MEKGSEGSDKNSSASVLKEAFATIGTSVLFGVILSESLFLYFVDRGLRTPEGIIVPILVLSTAFLIIAKCFSPVTAVLTFYVSIITVILTVDWYFGNSANPSILLDVYGFSFESGQDIFGDFLFIGLIGGGIWMALLWGTQNAISQLRMTPIRGIRFSLRSRITKLTVFFDNHPWLVPLLWSVITLIIGLLIGGLGR